MLSFEQEFRVFSNENKSSLSSTSIDDRVDSLPSSVPPVIFRASESTDDNIPLIHREIPRHNGSGFLRRSVKTTPVSERSSGKASVPHHVDEDIIELDDDHDYDHYAENPPGGGDHLTGHP